MKRKPWIRTRIPPAALAVGATAILIAIVHHAAADAPPGRFSIASEAVVDAKTGLTWQQAVPAQPLTWSEATTYCATGTGLPGAGWRLPSMKELQTIVDESRSNPSIDEAAFPSTPVEAFWTSSPMAGSATIAWYVYFSNGDTYSNDVSIANRVRCVR